MKNRYCGRNIRSEVPIIILKKYFLKHHCLTYCYRNVDVELLIYRNIFVVSVFEKLLKKCLKYYTVRILTVVMQIHAKCVLYIDILALTDK